jgi:GNAT superfamily N-acetyltransferase
VGGYARPDSPRTGTHHGQDSAMKLHNVIVSSANPHLSIVPANQVACDDLQAVFGSRGSAAKCQCQRYKLQPKEFFAGFPVEERIHRLRQQTDCGNETSGSTSGLVAHLNSDPVGWCAVEPRTAYVGLLRNGRVPWAGRDQDKSDDSVWAVTCVFTRAGYRRRGISRALIRAAVDLAREQGARAIEAYPVIATENAIEEELHVGTRSMFAVAGFSEVSRPTVRRAVMRIDF